MIFVSTIISNALQTISGKSSRDLWRVQMESIMPKETYKVLETCTDGHFFGERAMLGSTHPASVVCMKHAELFSLSRASLIAIMQDYPQYQAELGLSMNRLELLSKRPPV
jgi:CRP-like cAMP-binding protein